MSVLVGKKAPEFKAPAVVNGNEVVEDFSLEQYKGKKYVVFYFYPEDFTFVCPTVIIAFQEKIEEGDVLVIPFSDSSWTPLFSKAKAVISQSGGILSHCSIIAREYGIPAVVSVKEALQIEDGTKVTVDGYTRKITLA